MPNFLSSITARTVLDVVNAIAGAALALSPWFLGYVAETYAAWNAWLVGAAIALVAVGAVVAFHEAEEWVNLVLGAWAVVSPWALGFSTLATVPLLHVVVGLVVAAVAASRLWVAKGRPFSTA